MRILTPLLFVFLSAAASAQTFYDIDSYDFNQSRLGDVSQVRPVRPVQPGRPQPPRPPEPGRPGYNDYGPNRTVRWADFGTKRIPKLVTETITLNVRGQFVNEILFYATGNEIEISSVTAYLSNGQAIDLRYSAGVIREGRELRSSLDYRYSLRVDRIVIRAEAPNLIGSRPTLQTYLGLAY